MKNIKFISILFLALTLALTSCREEKKTPEDKLEATIKKVEAEAKENSEELSDDVQDALEDVKDEIEEIKEEANKK